MKKLMEMLADLIMQGYLCHSHRASRLWGRGNTRRCHLAPTPISVNYRKMLRPITTFLLIAFSLCQMAAQPAIGGISLELPSAHFTNPAAIREGQADSSLVGLVARLIEATPAGDTVYVCMFKFNLDRLVSALLAAQGRGVVVRLILDNGKNSRETNELVREQLTGRLSESLFLRNPISKKAIIHNKFVLFSGVHTSAGDKKHLVIQTSSNFQDKDLDKLQDLLALSDEELYVAYRDYWLTIERLGRSDKLEDYHFQTVRSSQDNWIVFFLPMRRHGEKWGEDPVVTLLKKIDDPSRAHLRLAMGKWDENRKDLLEELRKVAEAGARIEVLLSTANDQEVKEKIRDIGAIEVHKLRKKEANLHTKYFLVDAVIEGKQRRIVFTGSQNFTGRSLHKNFEVLLGLEDQRLYQAYVDNFERLSGLSQD